MGSAGLSGNETSAAHVGPLCGTGNFHELSPSKTPHSSETFHWQEPTSRAKSLIRNSSKSHTH